MPTPEPVPEPTLPPSPGPALSTSAPHTEIVLRRPRPGLLAAGLVLFAVSYGATIGVTYGYDHQPATTSLIPFVGPFLQMTEKYGLEGPPVDTGSAEADARVTQNIDSANDTIRSLALAGAAISGIFQLTGLALTIAGAVTKRKITRYALSPSRSASSARSVTLSPTPTGLSVGF